MKKIGIITHYYKSINYGGNLQAYALCVALKKLSIYAEQICYPLTDNRRRTIKRVFVEEGISGLVICLWARLKVLVLGFVRKRSSKETESSFLHILETRRQSFSNFNNAIIPNSRIVYNDDTILKSNECYDGFITGSDQVWNFNLFRPGYFLRFVRYGKKKISYAASVSMNSFNKEQKEYTKESLKNYNAISVREDSAKTMIQELTDLDVKVVVDPDLLLGAEEWEKLCKENSLDEAYVFAYFLGDNEQSRILCKEFAQLKGLKIVTIYMAGKDGRFIDEGFGDIAKNDASPEDFITLIKNAQYIFTDSFHATVFSYIFSKQFFVFDRSERKEMNSRIKDIVKLLGTEKRYCSGVTYTQIEYLHDIEDIDYSKKNHELQKRIVDSYSFLRESLGG